MIAILGKVSASGDQRPAAFVKKKKESVKKV
jgi:hypothetical protein